MRNNTSGNSDLDNMKIEENDAMNTSQTIAVLEYSPEKVIELIKCIPSPPHIVSKWKHLMWCCFFLISVRSIENLAHNYFCSRILRSIKKRNKSRKNFILFISRENIKLPWQWILWKNLETSYLKSYQEIQVRIH